MKKTLIALAAVAATGAAMAQSSVTIDGAIDLGIVKPLGATGARLDATNGASQIRFRGTEDLGGGLKANFIVAMRFSPESGRFDGTGNNRPLMQGESTVGLSGGFGSVKLGRSLTALQGPVNTTDPWGTLTVASTAVLTTGYVTDPVANVDGEGAGRTDAITYNSPSFGGFSAGLSYGFKNSNAAPGGAAVKQAENMISLWGQYANGPIYVGGGYEQNRADDDVTVILGTYDFGSFKLGAGWAKVDLAAGNEHTNWNIMATVPMGAVTLKAGYGVVTQDKAAGGVVTGVKLSKKLGVGVDYALSKRTTIYTNFGRDSVRVANKSGFDVGVRHTF